MKINQYELKARLFPAVISMTPLFVLSYFFLNSKLAMLTQYVLEIKIFSYGTVGLIFIFLYMHICRLLGKIYQNTFFKGDLFMPTTEYLLYSNGHYSSEFKDKIRKKIRSDFNMESPKPEDEKSYNLESRKIISEAVSQIRLKVGGGKLLLQHNIEYGFWRNLIGGATVSLLLSLIDIYLMRENQFALVISVVLFIVFFLIVILSKYIIRKLGNNYARVLIEEYLSL